MNRVTRCRPRGLASAHFAVLGLCLLLAPSCSPYPIGPGLVEELLCSFSVWTAGPAPIIGSVSVFEHGLVEVQDSSNWVVISRLTPEQLEVVRSTVTGREFQEEVNRLSLEHPTPSCSDCAGVGVYYRADGYQSSMDLSTEEVSAVLRSHLEKVDGVIREVFGRRYQFRLADGRWSSD